MIFKVSRARFSEMETLSPLGDIPMYFNVFWHDKLKFCLLFGRQEVESLFPNITLQVQASVICLKIHAMISKVDNKTM